MEFTGRIALVTGASSGIGKAVALRLASEGAEVIVHGRDKDRGDAVVATIISAGGVARFVAGELSDAKQIAELAREVGEIDVLINNAAIFPGGPATDADAAAFDLAFAANVRAPYLLTAAVAPAMITKGGGVIVNVSTMAATVGMAGLSVYSATKAALESLTRTWAVEFGAAGIRVNAVAPGPTRTDMVMTAMGEEGAAQVAATTLLNRLATPEEIAEVIVFAASDRASYLTGSVIHADAGRTAV